MVCVRVFAWCSLASKVCEAGDRIKFMILTRSSTVNCAEYDPFPVYVDRLDKMKTVREKAINYCHSDTDVSMDKLATTKLKMHYGEKNTVPFHKTHTELTVQDYVTKYDIKPPFSVIMPLTSEMVGGGSKRATTLVCFKNMLSD